MFGKRNVQQAFTSRYLSSEVGWTREGGGGVVCAQPGYVMAGRERDRQEPVLMPIPVPDTSEALLSLRAAQLCWMFGVKFRNTTVLPPCTPTPFDFGCQDKTALYAAVRQEYSADIQNLISASNQTWVGSADTSRCSCSLQVIVKSDHQDATSAMTESKAAFHWVPQNWVHMTKLCGDRPFIYQCACLSFRNHRRRNLPISNNPSD